jgi:protein QN1
VTDEDVGSTLDEMNKNMTKSVSMLLESAKPKNEIMSDEGSIKELLQEAEKLVQQNGNDLLKGVLKTEIIAPDQNDTKSEGLTRVRQLEVDIFKMIEQQDNDIQSVKRSVSPSVEILFENINSKKTLESQEKKNLEEQKVEVSSNSDIDDPIERHSIIEDVHEKKKLNDKKENLKKEITDVDKDFFDALIKQTKESNEPLWSQNLSFDKEDFNHFLKLLQDQSDKEESNLSERSSLNLVVDQFDPLKEKKEFVDNELNNAELKGNLHELNSPKCQAASPRALKIEKLSIESTRKHSSKHSSIDSSKQNSAKSSASDTKNVVNDKNELYTVGLTPRLKLFADAIPKLLAEKSNETSSKKDECEKQENEITPKSEGNEDFSFKNFKALDTFTQMDILNEHKNVKDVKDFKDHIDFRDSKVSDYQRNLQNSVYLQNNVKCTSDNFKTRHATNIIVNRNSKGEAVIAKSRSYDQLSKSSNKLGSSLENIKNIKTIESRKSVSANLPKKLPVPKIKVQPKVNTKLNPKTKMSVKTTKEPMKRKFV